MDSLKPYYIRSIHQWAVDNGHTPHVLVDANKPGVNVPDDYVKDGEIVLNVHPQAVASLDLGNEWLMFLARFAGRSYQVEVPVYAVRAVFARENGQGMTFPEVAADLSEVPIRPPRPDMTHSLLRKGPVLRVVK
ncbi:MAG: ClpXP protease specificity-enhancing factor [Proteobacteria bacterium]|nr:ClpXP protease specificity-enhancing factor [Pseudomonadota bacterium]